MGACLWVCNGRIQYWYGRSLELATNSTCNDRMLLFIGSYTTRYFILILHRTCILGNTVIGTAIRTLKQKLDCIVVLLQLIPLPLHPTLL